MIKKAIFICVLFNFIFNSKTISQNKIYFAYDDYEEFTIISTVVKELKYNIPNREYYLFDFIIEYEGKLDSALHYLFNMPLSKIKIKGKIPEKNVYFKSIDFYHKLPFDYKEIAVETLKKQYNFDVEEIKENSEVWVLNIKDQKKLDIFRTPNENNNILGNSCSFKKVLENGLEVTYFDINNMPLIHLSTCIENESSKIVYSQVSSQNYRLQIPQNVLKSPLEILNAYIEDKFGLNLKVEKRVENFILITFNS